MHAEGSPPLQLKGSWVEGDMKHLALRTCVPIANLGLRGQRSDLGKGRGQGLRSWQQNVPDSIHSEKVLRWMVTCERPRLLPIKVGQADPASSISVLAQALLCGTTAFCPSYKATSSLCWVFRSRAGKIPPLKSCCLFKGSALPSMGQQHKPVS